MAIHKPVQLSAIELGKIKLDPVFTPEYLGLRGSIAAKPEVVEEYLSLFRQLDQVAECFKVWQHEDGYYLLDNYEAYEAALRFLGPTPDAERVLNCIVVQGADKLVAKELGNRLRELRGGTGGYHERCFNLMLLHECGCTLRRVQQMYGVTKKKSTKGKMLERDFRLVTHKVILNRVIGFSEERLPNFLDLAINKPSPLKATLTYAQALEALRILRNDEACIQEFDRRYQAYLDDLAAKHQFPGEETKPVFKRQNYSRHRVKAIAVAVSRSGAAVDFNQDALLGDPELEDQAWRPALNQRTYDLPIPSFKVNLATKSDSNIKKIVDLKYKMETLARSLDSYIKRIEPVAHGDLMRVKDDTIEPHFETRGNMPKWEDYSYFNYIRHRKLLRYCNRETLLRSIGLKAHVFGFKSYHYSERSTWKAASDGFSAWMDSAFRSHVELNYGGDEERHPRHVVYVELKLVLAARADDQSTVLFFDFVKELFTKAFDELDKRRWLMAEKYAQVESNREIARAVFSRALPDKLSEANITPEEAARLLQGQPHYKQQVDALVSMVAQIQMQVDQLSEDLRDSA